MFFLFIRIFLIQLNVIYLLICIVFHCHFSFKSIWYYFGFFFYFLVKEKENCLLVVIWNSWPEANNFPWIFLDRNSFIHLFIQSICKLVITFSRSSQCQVISLVLFKICSQNFHLLCLLNFIIKFSTQFSWKFERFKKKNIIYNLYENSKLLS